MSEWNSVRKIGQPEPLDFGHSTAYPLLPRGAGLGVAFGFSEFSVGSGAIDIPDPECFLVLDGELFLSSQGENWQLGAGQAIWMPGGVQLEATTKAPCRVAYALMPGKTIAAEAKDWRSTVKLEQRPAVKSGETSVSYPLIPKSAGVGIALGIGAFEPGFAAFSADRAELFLVKAGELTVRADGVAVSAGPGEAIWVPQGKAISFETRESTEVVYLVLLP